MPEVYNPEGNIAQRHPAETAAPVAMAVGLLIARAFDAGADVQFAVAVILSFVPTAITWLVHTIQGVRHPPSEVS